MSGSSNTATGEDALRNNTTGAQNTASGNQALINNTTGSYNTGIGFGADVSPSSLINATAIGANARVNASNKIRLGDTLVTLVETAGNLRVGAGGTTGCVQDGDGTVIAGTSASDVRFKTNIHPFGSVLDKLVQLQPVYFHWKAEQYPERQFGTERSYGLIAQDTERVLPELVASDAQGFKAVRYSEIPLLMLHAIEEQQEQVKALQAENAALRARLDRLEWMNEK